MLKKNYYRRKRMDAVLSGIFEFPLTVVVASTGYGKTTTIRQYLLEKKIDGMFVNLHRDDEEALWEGICREMEEKNPQAALSLRAVGLPHSDLEIARIVEIIKTQCLFPLYLIVDDCQLLDRESAFFDLVTILIFEEIDDFHLILISQTMLPIKVGTLASKGLCLIIDREILAFTAEETGGYLMMRGLNLTREMVLDIQANSGGWISILFCICEGFRRGATDYQTKTINRLFEENFLIAFDPVARDMLIRLSVLSEFNEDLAVVSTGNASIREILKPMEQENAFLTRDEDGMYHFHALLKDYLSRQCKEDAMQRALYLRVGHWYSERKEVGKALDYFMKGQRPQAFFESLNHPGFFWKVHINRQTLYDAVRIIPEEQWPLFPYPMMHTAFALISGGKTAFARQGLKILKVIEAYYTNHDHPQGHIFLGDCILIRTFLGIYPDDDWNDHMIEAMAIFEEDHSDVFHATDPITFGMPMFIYLEYRHPGSLNKVIEEDMHCPLEIMIPGFGHGMDFLIQAEAALMRCQREEAAFFAQKATVAVQEEDQYYMEISAIFTLLRLALLNGDVIQAIDTLESIRKVVEMGILQDERVSPKYVHQVMTLCEGFLYASLGQVERIPECFISRTAPRKQQYDATMGLYQYIRGRSAAQMENYAVALAEYESVLNLWSQEVQHSQLIRLSAEVQMALVKNHLLMTEEAHGHFVTALKEAAMDEVMLPFVENASVVLPLLMEIKKKDDIPKVFLEELVQQCREQKKRMVNVRVPDTSRPLTPREREILKLVADGLTQKQIGERLDIKAVTVKKHLISVYAKLGVSGKVAAIRLAKAKKIL